MDSDVDLVRLVKDVDRACRLHGRFVLRSGVRTDTYFDKYRLESDPQLLGRVVDRMVDLVPAGVDMLAGLELGGVPLVTLLSQRTGLPALFVRKAAKEYGTRQVAEGGDPGGRGVLLVEDVITTGGAVREAAGKLRAAGAMVATVVCVIDRSAPGSSPLADAGLEVRSVMTRGMLDEARGRIDLADR